MVVGNAYKWSTCCLFVVFTRSDDSSSHVLVVDKLMLVGNFGVYMAPAIYAAVPVSGAQENGALR